MRQEPKNSGNALEDGIETESRLQLIVDTTPALIYSARPERLHRFLQSTLPEFVGVSFKEMSGWDARRPFIQTTFKEFWPVARGTTQLCIYS